ncbi:MAG TPA: hypothetical protein PKD90_10990 [Phnomibacter sp.]|nr:hypothetical protein [Phnomibacter sp.]
MYSPLRMRLSRQQLLALVDLLQQVINRVHPYIMLQRLMRCMMERLCIDLQHRALTIKQHYRLSWHPERAMAFYVCMQSIHVALADIPYEQALVQRICQLIEQQYTYKIH